MARGRKPTTSASSGHELGEGPVLAAEDVPPTGPAVLGRQQVAAGHVADVDQVHAPRRRDREHPPPVPDAEPAHHRPLEVVGADQVAGVRHDHVAPRAGVLQGDPLGGPLGVDVIDLAGRRA